MRKLLVKLMYVRFALKNINKPKLGETVIFQNMECTLIQGSSNPYWSLVTDKKKRIDRVHVSQFKQLKTLSAYWFRFKSSYDFLMGSWFYIDCNAKNLFNRIQYKW